MRINIKIDPNEWGSLENFLRKKGPTLKRAMLKSMALLHGQIRTNLTGPSHTTFPGNGNPYPGTVTGRMKNSIHVDPPKQTKDKIVGRVGPNVHYAKHHITGTRFIPKRNFLEPAWKKHRKAISKIFKDEIGATLHAGNKR